MGSKLRCLKLLLWTVLATSASAHAATMTLEQALAAAYDTNPKLAAQRASLRATDEDVNGALSGWKPTISVTGNYGYTQNTIGTFLPIPDGRPRGITATLTQPIFTGETIPLTRKAKAEVRAGEAKLTSVEQSVLLDAAKAYFNVMTAEAILGYRRQNVTLLTNQLHMAQDRISVQDISRTDEQLVESRLSGAEADEAAAESALAGSRAEFLRTIGRPAETLDQSPKLPNLPASHDEAMNRVLSGNPDLLTAREQAEAADAEVAAAYDSFLPTLSLQAQYQSSTDMIGVGISNNATSVIAQIRVPIYQAGTDYADVRKANQNRTAADSSIRDVQGQVQANFETNWQAQLSATQGIRFHKLQQDTAQSAYNGFEEGVRAGQSSTYDLLNSAQEVLSAQIALAQAQQQYYVSLLQVMATMGNLTAASLHLPVTIYDPNVYYDRNVGRWIGFGN